MTTEKIKEKIAHYQKMLEAKEKAGNNYMNISKYLEVPYFNKTKALATLVAIYDDTNPNASQLIEFKFKNKKEFFFTILKDNPQYTLVYHLDLEKCKSEYENLIIADESSVEN